MASQAPILVATDLAKAFTAGGIDQGYLVVVELDDRPAPVNLADIVAEVIAAEGRIAVPR